MLYNPDFPSKDLKFPENNPKNFRNPSERGMLYDNVELQSGEFKLAGWFIKQQDSFNCDTIIYFHENAGNIGNRLWSIENMYKQLNVNVMIVGYRGYGHSEGSPNEVGIE